MIVEQAAFVEAEQKLLAALPTDASRNAEVVVNEVSRSERIPLETVLGALWSLQARRAVEVSWAGRVRRIAHAFADAGQ